MGSEYSKERQKEEDQYDWLSGILYYDEFGCDENGWFSVDEIVSFISKIRQYDHKALMMRVESDTDHRFIFNEDKTKLRISPEHIAPKSVEEQMQTADDLEIEPSVFEINRLPLIEDAHRQIVFTANDGRTWRFPFVTNKVFYLDKQRFFMLVESEKITCITVCAFLTKKSCDRYRFAFESFPPVLNYIFAADSELVDFEGNKYRTCIETG